MPGATKVATSWETRVILAGVEFRSARRGLGRRSCSLDRDHYVSAVVHAGGRASSPKSALTRSYHESSSRVPQPIHASSLIAWRQARNGRASGPTGCRSYQVSPAATSRILSATRDAGVGVLSAAVKSAALRRCCGYEEGASGGEWFQVVTEIRSRSMAAAVGTASPSSLVACWIPAMSV